jgi:transcriptional regulator with XRE-family HTH domain
MTTQEKYDALISKEVSPALERAKERKKNRKRLRESQAIAIKVLNKLDELGWTQKRLASELGVSPQQVTKIVSGKANLTLQTQTQLQDILNIPILATWYEDAIEKLFSKSFTKKVPYEPPKAVSISYTINQMTHVESLTKKVSTNEVDIIFDPAA